MRERAKPPADISPKEFFTVWLPARVAEDQERRERLGDTAAVLLFDLGDEQGGLFTVKVADGVLIGSEGRAAEPDLEIKVDLETWRALNSGAISAPEALLRRRLHLSGKLMLALKLHLILG
jgi:putative sterol carrier protein